MKKFIILAGLGVAIFFLLNRRSYAATQENFPDVIYSEPWQYYPQQAAQIDAQIEDLTRYETQQGNAEPFPVVEYAPEAPDNWDLQGQYVQPEAPDNWDLQGERVEPVADGWNIINDALSFLTGEPVMPASTGGELTTQQQQNLFAFLQTIQYAEHRGLDQSQNYRRLFGGELIDDMTDHPRRVVRATLGGKSIASSAAGAYQALTRTWDDFIRAVGPRDFSPESQDEFAIWAIRRRGALADVLAGRFDAAINKVRNEWASMPAATYGQPTVALNELANVYAQNGGTFANGATYV